MKYALSEAAKTWERSNSLPFIVPPIGGDAGYDIRSVESVVIFAGEQRLISTGIFLNVPPTNVALIKDRRSMSLKRVFVNSEVIHASFRDELKVILENRNHQNYHVEPGEKIAQLIFLEIQAPSLIQITKAELTSRGGDVSESGTK